MPSQVTAAVREVGRRILGGYSELLRMPGTARFAIGAVVASMPFPMVGMTITISVQRYYGSYTLAGSLTAIQAISLAVMSPLLGKLVDKFGQRQVSIPTIGVWMVAAASLTTAISSHAPIWALYCITPFMAAIPPWGAMSRQRWTLLLKGDHVRTERALSLCGVLDEAMWVVGNPLASILAVISGILAFSFTGVCVAVGALMFLTELSTEPPSQTVLARRDGVSRKVYRARQARIQAQLQGEEGSSAFWSSGLVAVCITWFGLGAFQSAASISIISFASEQGAKQMTGFIFACFSFSSLIGALMYGAKSWTIPLWKRFYFCLLVVNLGIASFMFARNIWTIMAIYLVIGVCQAPTWINGNQLMLHLVPPFRFTEGMAWLNAMNSIGSSAGSAIAGVFIDRYGSQGGFSVVTFLALTSLAIAFIGFKQIRGSTQRPDLTVIPV
ncbi:major facilitator superfamily protein [Bifidobacterium actinocoloniiforme DSM 22766]|uniref:Major facilitator superfamily protein n=1 Tax=Bifidobacterium actinocoloniiforme DSM 22766 TaxID=1437605 RepID=A0A086Z1W6_9BIFI|nr:MFS transporter [Bifidobacterium actinocoloniiforme]AKV55614.1 MFS transporter [Bifidobacterium actinocoloniiforme DSM 22766]KFI40516.1 major facilitator superfamily protein [Bifidobacterium actinocoloniiforme DSM 22766]